MATSPAAKPVSKEPETPGRKPFETIDGLPGRTLTLLGKTYKLRMLLTEENDAALDGAKGPDGTINSRLQTRLVLGAMLTDHPGLVEISKIPQPVLERLIETANEINDPDNLEDDPNA